MNQDWMIYVNGPGSMVFHRDRRCPRNSATGPEAWFIAPDDLAVTGMHVQLSGTKLHACIGCADSWARELLSG